MRRAPDERALLDLLGVDERAAWKDVRQAFRDAVRASHPDLHAADPDAESRLKTLNAAWESINSPTKWAAYTLQPAFGAATGSSGPSRGSDTVATVGRLRVQRQQQGSYGLLNWNVELDGEVIASIQNGGISVFDSGPGQHSVRVVCGSRSSVPLQVELHLGEELVLGCRTPESLRLSLFSPKRSLVLEFLTRRPLVSQY